MATFFNDGAELFAPCTDPERASAVYYSPLPKIYVSNSFDISIPVYSVDSSPSIYINQIGKFYLLTTVDITPLPIAPIGNSALVYYRNNAHLYLENVQAVNIGSLRAKVYRLTDLTSEIILEPYFTSRPILISPFSGSLIRLGSPIFNWRSVSNADFYEIHVALDPGFQKRAFRFNSYDTQFQAALDFGNRYYWRVRAVSMAEGITVSDFSDVWYLDVPALIPDRQSSHRSDGGRRLLSQFQEAN